MNDETKQAVADATAPLRRRLALVQSFEWSNGDQPPTVTYLVKRETTVWYCYRWRPNYADILCRDGQWHSQDWPEGKDPCWPDPDVLFAELERQGLLPEER